MLCCASPSPHPSSSSPSPLKRLKLLSSGAHRRRINSVQVVDAAHKVAILDAAPAAGWPLQSPAFFGAKSAFFNSAASSPLRYDHDHDHDHDHFLLSNQPYGFLFTIAEETKEEMELQSSGQLLVNINVVGAAGAADPSLPGPPLSSSVSSPSLSCRAPADPVSPAAPSHDCTLSTPSSAAQIILARRSLDGAPLITGSPGSSGDTVILPNSCSRSDQTNIHCYSPDSAWSANYILPAAAAVATDSARSLSDRISKTSPSRDSGGSPPSSSNSSDTPFLTPLSSPADVTAAHHTLVRSRSIQYSALSSALSSSNSGRFHIEMPSEAWSHFSPDVDSSYMYDDHGTLGTLFRRPYTSPSRYSPLRPTAWSGRITDFRKWKVFHNSLSLS